MQKYFPIAPNSSLQLVFSLCGFSNAITFKSIDNDDIDSVEQFVQNELDLCVRFSSNVKVNSGDDLIDPTSNENKVHFYGSYASNPKQFKFSAVDRKIVELLVTNVKETVDFGGVNQRLAHFSQGNASDETIKNDTYECEFFGGSKDDSFELNTQSTKISRTHYFLEKLVSAADRNSVREKSGYRYDHDVKQMATYFRMLAGPLAYESIQRNLECSLPTLSSTNRYIRKMNCNIVEGILRCEELRKYLEERNLPLTVSLSEDATRINGRVQYDVKTNQIVGFAMPIDAQTGMPIAYSFMARNDTEILQHFTSEQTAHFVNVIMAHPLGKAPPFCLLLFGTNSKYTAEDVSKRWMHIVNQLNESNISVLSISSDSDPKYNSAMRKNSGLGSPMSITTNSGPVDWFSCANLKWPFYVQDTTHIGTKMRNFFLKTKSNSKMLPFGKKHFIDIQHVEYVRRNFSRSEHMMCASTLNPVDRQNFKSVQTMCDKKVSSLLRKFVPNSEGTAKYLEMMRDVIDAFMNPDLTAIERIEKMWYSLFLIRIWRQFILSSKNLTLKKNFLTQYTYICIELNAHSLVLLIDYLRENKQTHLFMPELFSSQPCEAFFRKIRSYTSTYSTVANCTVKEIMDRINKLQLQSDIPTYNSENFIFPR